MAFRCVLVVPNALNGHSTVGEQEIAWNLRGKVAKCDHREYGFAQVQMHKIESDHGVQSLFNGLGEELKVRALSA